MSSTDFIDYTTETAPERSRGALQATADKFGFVPSAMARMAASPAATTAFGRLLALWDATSFSPIERETLAMTMGHYAGCHVCLALHSALLARSTAPELLAALREQRTLPDARLEALRTFTLVLLDRRGAASDAELAAFLDAGFTKEQALELVIGIATYVLSTFANRLTRASVDAPFAAFAIAPAA
jgi:AhpD family alkylhydroperoxidase